MVLGNALVSAVFFIWVLGMVIKIRRKPPVSGREEMLNATGEAMDDFTGKGYVRIRGEIWQAVSDTPVKKGQSVRIKSIDGLVLHVDPQA
jgi:membrane-bound serine protease (ClpP class)